MSMLLFVFQGFQEAVAESAGRLNALLQQGEELIQRSEPADAQVIESQLQELLLYCARVFQGLGRLHTRLLSMRLVSITILVSQIHCDLVSCSNLYQTWGFCEWRMCKTDPRSCFNSF